MSCYYILHEQAQQDYETSLHWYMERNLQAAENFIIDISNTLQLICDNPTRWRNTYKHYYELGLKQYPYTIVYTIEKDKNLIVITAIYHHKRNPKQKYRMLK